MPAAVPEDRDWQAFCYVAREMDEAECQAFELQLHEDAALCDAVERAVELQEAIRATTPVTLSDRRPTRRPQFRRPGVWVATAVAAAVLVMAIALGEFRQPADGNSAGTQQPGTDSAVVGSEASVSLAWAALDRGHVDGSAVLPTMPWAGPDVVDDSEGIYSDVIDPAGGMPPQWLLTAVTVGPEAEGRNTP